MRCLCRLGQGSSFALFSAAKLAGSSTLRCFQIFVLTVPTVRLREKSENALIGRSCALLATKKVRNSSLVLATVINLILVSCSAAQASDQRRVSLVQGALRVAASQFSPSVRRAVVPRLTAEQRRALKRFCRRPHPVVLHGAIQEYAWGGYHQIPARMGVPNDRCDSYAELWFGAHPDGMTEAVLHDRRGKPVMVPVGALISYRPARVLSTRSIWRFGGQLPFLLKILDAREPLSIQVHPPLERAQRGFRREELEGISLADSDRIYKDANHKPEQAIALTDVYALHGFRPIDEIARVIADNPELRLIPQAKLFEPTDQRLKQLYRAMMTMSQERVNEVLEPLMVRVLREANGRAYAPSDARHWLLEADDAHSQDGRRDRGLFSVLLFNLVHLAPGGTIFTGAGKPHAYLHGTMVEIMSTLR